MITEYEKFAINKNIKTLVFLKFPRILLGNLKRNTICTRFQTIKVSYKNSYIYVYTSFYACSLLYLKNCSLLNKKNFKIKTFVKFSVLII